MNPFALEDRTLSETMLRAGIFVPDCWIDAAKQTETDNKRLREMAQLLSTYAACQCSQQFCDHFNEAAAIADEFYPIEEKEASD